MSAWRAAGRGAYCGILVASTLVFAGLPATGDEVAYRVAVDGLPSDTTKGLFDGGSQLITLEDKPPPSVTALAARVKSDIELATKVLNAFGYYDAAVKGAVDDEQSPVLARITVTAGQRYGVGEIRLLDAAGAPLDPALSPHPVAMPLVTGKKWRAQAVLDAEALIIANLGRQGRPFAKILHRDAVLDRPAHVINVTFAVDPGPPARFGATRFDGLDRLNRSAAAALLDWTEGETVDMDKVEKTRLRLVEAGIFRTVTIGLEPPGADGLAPVVVTVGEAPPRTLGGGLTYTTGEGFGTKAFWEHRNLFGNREKLRVTGRFAQTGFGLTARAVRPDVRWRDVDLVAQGELQHDTLEAYDIDRAAVSGGLEWRVDPQLFLSGAVSLEQSHIQDVRRTEDYTLLGLPLVARHDTTDDALDPTQGHRLLLGLTPYYDLLGPAGVFMPVTVTGSTYFALDAEKDFVFAVRGGLGATLGPGTLTLPADKRFYAGGSDSVRGFAYQKAGPLDDDGDPEGGRSLVSAGAELRWRVTKAIGIVPFIDGGSVFPTAYPDFSGDFFVGAGLGLRYLSPIGPLRLDVATPLLGKRKSDDIVQIYISIGQAF